MRHASEQDELEAIDERCRSATRERENVGAHRAPDEMIAGKQVEQIVQRAIAELEPSFRECLVLRDVEELSYEEIGEITGLPDGTVKSRIHRRAAS